MGRAVLFSKRLAKSNPVIHLRGYKEEISIGLPLLG